MIILVRLHVQIIAAQYTWYPSTKLPGNSIPLGDHISNDWECGRSAKLITLTNSRSATHSWPSIDIYRAQTTGSISTTVPKRQIGDVSCLRLE